MNNIKISKNFKLKEFADIDGRVKIHPYLVMQVQKFRDLVGMPVIITRGYVSKDRARKIKLSTSSANVQGKGVDISIINLKKKYTNQQLIDIARKCNFKNIQIYNGNTMHLEVIAANETMNKIKLSKNFSLHEFECKNGDRECMVHSKLLSTLQKYRDTLGRPLVITSGYRTPAHDKSVGGSGKGQHTKGTAVDIRLSSIGTNVDNAARIAERVGFDGIGKYRTHIHVDTRGYRSRWDYR